VAVIMPRDAGLAQVTAPSSVEVIAVLMPNDAGIRTNGWQQYRVSVDRVEQVSGFDLLSALPDAIEAIVEAITP
jgi:endonuclease G